MPNIPAVDADDGGHRCPYCGDEDVDEDHILDCQPFDVET